MLIPLRTRLAALPREARDTLFLLAVIAWVVLPHVPRLPAWCSAMALGVLAWRGWLAVGSRPLPRGRWVVALLVLDAPTTKQPVKLAQYAGKLKMGPPGPGEPPQGKLPQGRVHQGRVPQGGPPGEGPPGETPPGEGPAGGHRGVLGRAAGDG